MTSEKDVSKLTSIDEHGSRIGIIPAEVRGYFRTWRSRLQFVLLTIFLSLPWIQINGNQAILLNIPSREFNFFGLLFRAHDAPLFFLVLAVLVIGLAFVTAIWGRIWCGWACPQTVFIDFVFRRIEFLIEGNYIERRRLANGPDSFKKFLKIIIKWILFVLVSSIIAHCFIAYFAGSKELISMMNRDPSENWNYFLLVTFVTALVLFDFAWFREQFCVIMCPYGRIQSVLLERNSLAVVYDHERGEPRKGASLLKEKTGDCVSCNRCVEVCPTGIDIRNGLQMECIACTACIDACDEIMAKVKKPKGLISYKTLNGRPLRFFKIKTVFYGLIILLSISVLAYNLIEREPLDIALLRSAEAPYLFSVNESGEPTIQNHFRLHLTNQTGESTPYRIVLSAKSKEEGFILTLAQNPILLKEKSSETVHVFIQIEKQRFSSNGRATVEIALVAPTGVEFRRELPFVGPVK